MPKRTLGPAAQIKADRKYQQEQKEKGQANRLRKAHRRFFEFLVGYR